MRDAVYDWICVAAIAVGLGVVAVGVGNGALSTPSLLLGTEDPKGIFWVEVGLWIVAGAVFGLTTPERAVLIAILTMFAALGFGGANHMAMQEESMRWIALGLCIFAVAGGISMLIRPRSSTLRVPLAMIVLSLAAATFAYTRQVPPRANPIPAHMMPAERPE